MYDPLEILDRLSTRKRRRLYSLLFGNSALRPSQEMLAAIADETSVPDRVPDFFGLDVEIDALIAAFLGAKTYGDSEAPPIHDRRALLEFDGLAIDAVAAYRGEQEGDPITLVLLEAKASGKWGGRSSRILFARLREAFGEDGTGLPGARPLLITLCPDRPVPAKTAAWAAWMKNEDDSGRWIPYGRKKDEIRIVRCDRRGHPRRIGEYWKLI